MYEWLLGVGLATGEWRAAQVRGTHHLPFGIWLLSAVGSCLSFCHSLLDPYKTWRRYLASCCSAVAALKLLSQPPVSGVEADPWRRALTERPWRNVGMRYRRRTTWANKKHHWDWFYSICCEDHTGYCRAQDISGSPSMRVVRGTDPFPSVWFVAYFFSCHRSKQQYQKLESCMDAVTLAVAIRLKPDSKDSYTSEFAQHSVVAWEVKESSHGNLSRSCHRLRLEVFLRFRKENCVVGPRGLVWRQLNEKHSLDGSPHRYRRKQIWCWSRRQMLHNKCCAFDCLLNCCASRRVLQKTMSLQHSGWWRVLSV